MKTNAPTSLRRKRKAADITQEELARRVGLRQSNLSRIEHGKQQPTLRVALAIAEHLGVDVSPLRELFAVDATRSDDNAEAA
jgi:transcriptional regulator with XRE-family HTH domain